MSECSLNNKDCGCTTCNLSEWVVVYELAVIIILLLFIYTEIERPKETKVKEE